MRSFSIQISTLKISEDLGQHEKIVERTWQMRMPHFWIHFKQQPLKSKFRQAQRMYLLQNSLSLDCIIAKYPLSSEPCLRHLWHQNFIYLPSNYSTRLQAAKKNMSFARSMTRMPTLRRTRKYSAHQCHLMIQTANARKQWQYSCFGRMPPTWQTLEQPNSGPSTCSSETFRNTFALYQTRVLASIS